MKKANDFFISHRGCDSENAKALYDLLKEINSEWEIFLDCGEQRPLESYEEWCDRMLLEAEHSRYLIFVSSSVEFLKKDHGWMYEEVKLFSDLKSTRYERNRPDRNVSYFGILFGEYDFERQLFGDPQHGSGYRKTYSRYEHLILPATERVETAKNRIIAKVKTMLGDSVDENAADILDRSREYAVAKRNTDPMFSLDGINEQLIPGLIDGQDRRLDFNGLLDGLEKTNVTITGYNGGCGKTTLMTKLFYHYLNAAELSDPGFCGMIPIYVEARGLLGRNYLILRYIAKTLYGESTARTDRDTSATVGLLDHEFSRKNDRPRYLILIDGYDEIPADCLAVFNQEMKDYLNDGCYQNVRLVIAGRNTENVFQEESFYSLEVSPLENNAIVNYLKENQVWSGKINEKLFEILSIPMYLTMYVELADSADSVYSKGTLLERFVERQATKDLDGNDTNEKKALYSILLFHFLPYIAYTMAMVQENKSMDITQSDLEDILWQAKTYLSDIHYKRYYGDGYREQFRSSGLRDFDELDLLDYAKEYFEEKCKLLRCNSDGRYGFHRVYRDYFCSRFLLDDMKRSAEYDLKISSLEHCFLEQDIKEFVAQALGEKAPFYNAETQSWDYSCNQESCLNRLLMMAKENGQGENPVVVSNLIELLKIVRAGDLSGMDFSTLNLTASDLRGCLLFREDRQKNHGSVFTKATIHSKNLLFDNHYSAITAACVRGDQLATIDNKGILKLWSLDAARKESLKTVTDVPLRINQLCFAADGSCLYGMAAREIIRIGLPETATGQAEIRVIYESRERLRTIGIDPQGELTFTTVFNSFNPKRVGAPQQEDTCRFYGFNTCSALNAAGNQLAFGHFTGYYGLKLYDWNETAGEWVEKRFGYSLILDQYLQELEALLRGFKLYHHFPNDNLATVRGGNKRASFFLHLRDQFEDRSHKHHEMPSLVLARVLKRLKSEEINLYPNQYAALKKLEEKFIQEIQLAASENPALFLLAGRRVQSVVYRPGEDVVLVSCSKKAHEEKNLYDSLVVELNTRTFETKSITRFAGKQVLKASYSDDKIVVNGDFQLTVFDRDGMPLKRMSTVSKQVFKLLYPESGPYFYALSYPFIYKIDQTGRCVGGYINRFNNYNVSAGVDEKGESYLFKQGRGLNLSNGVYETLPENLTPTGTPGYSVTIGNRKFKTCSDTRADKLVVFENDQKIDDIPICYNLFIAGCDFRGIQGGLSQPETLRVLEQYGATVDDLPEQPKDCHRPAAGAEGMATVSFVPDEELKSYTSPYVCHPGTQLKLRNTYKVPIGGTNLFGLKTWSLIHWGSYSSNALKAIDYSILEWVGQLQYASSKMIKELVLAGLIAQPESFKKIGDRMAQTLHSSYKLLCRFAFSSEGKDRGTPIYTLNSSFGVKVLKETANFSSNGYDYGYPRMILARNQWFTLTLARYADRIEKYALDSIFDTENHFSGRARVHGYIRLNGQALFAQVVRKHEGQPSADELRDKVHRLCVLAENKEKLYHDFIVESFDKTPIVVLIGEDFEHCRQLSERLQDVHPHIRKLYTYDVLLNSEESANGQGNYFEFVGGEAFAVNMKDLIL